MKQCFFRISLWLVECCLYSFMLATCPAEEENSAAPIPVPYRFTVSPARNGKCQVFKPSALGDESAVRQA